MNFNSRKNGTVQVSLGSDGKKEKIAAGRAKLMNIGGLILLFWGLFYPQPYEKVMMLLIAFPVLTLLVLIQYRGLITLDVDRYHKDRPFLLAAFLAPIVVLAFRAAYDWNILNWQGFWLPFTIVTIAFFILTITLAEDIRAKLSLIIIAFLFSAVFSFGAILSLNSVLDTSLAIVYQAKVLNKSVSSGKVTIYHLEISPWGPKKKASNTHVSKYIYDQKNVGDEVKLDVHQGRFGMLWYGVQ